MSDNLIELDGCRYPFGRDPDGVWMRRKARGVGVPVTNPDTTRALDRIIELGERCQRYERYERDSNARIRQLEDQAQDVDSAVNHWKAVIGDTITWLRSPVRGDEFDNRELFADKLEKVAGRPFPPENTDV